MSVLLKEVMEEGILDELYDLDQAGDLELDQRRNR